MVRNTFKAIIFVAIGIGTGLVIGWFMGAGLVSDDAMSVDAAQPQVVAPPRPAAQPKPATPAGPLQADLQNPNATQPAAGQPSSSQASPPQTDPTVAAKLPDGNEKVAKISRADDQSRMFEYRDLFVEEKQKEIEQKISDLADQRVNEQLQRRLELEDQKAFEQRRETTDAVDRLLVAASDAMSREAYHRPPGDNALHYYREALLLDPGDQRALEGVDAISKRFVEKAEFFLAAQDFYAARAAADIALATQTNNTEATKILQTLEQRQAEQGQDGAPAEREALQSELEELKSQLREQDLLSGVERETKAAVDRVLSAANAALKEGRLIKPADDNAFEYFVRAVSIDPDSGKARAGIEEVRNRLLRSGTQFIKAGNFTAARARVADLNRVDPSGMLARLLNQIIITNEQGPQIQTSNVAPDQAELMQRLRQAEERAADAELALRAIEQNGGAADAAASVTSPDLALIEGIADYDSGRYPQAYEKLKVLAAAEQPRASFQLALMQYYGRGIDANRDAALAQMVRVEPQVRQAASEGAAWAQFNVGLMYENGWIVARDLGEAIDWYRLSAQQGYAAAFNNLGVLYEQGSGVQRDRAKAVQFLRQAAAQGNAVARENLSQLGIN